MEFEQVLTDLRESVDKSLDLFLPKGSNRPVQLHEAMRYSVFAGGKRLRPILAILAHRSCGGTNGDIVPAACSLELIHTYSLIHDDLPAMDDDDLRRGKPTLHKQYDEATAILAGDALLTLAFQVLSDGLPDNINSAEIITEVSRAIGTEGMVGGQMVDIESEGKQGDADLVEYIHCRKTARLFRLSMKLGALIAGAEKAAIDSFENFGDKIGLAFQIIDDILDVESSPEEMGKSTQHDTDKMTYPSIFGIEDSRRKAESLIHEAKDILSPYKDSAGHLNEVANFILHRRK